MRAFTEGGSTSIPCVTRTKEQITRFVFLGSKVAAMAAKKSSVKETQRLAAALNSLAGDELSPPREDIHHFEALIDHYFDDDSGSEFGSECTEAVNSLTTAFLA